MIDELTQMDNETPVDLGDDFIYSMIKKMAGAFRVPVDILTHNTKYQNYEKENQDKS